MCIVALLKFAHPKCHLSYFWFLWVGFRIFVVSSHIYFGSIVDIEEGVMPIGGVHVSDTTCDLRYSVLVRLLVTYQVFFNFHFSFP